MESKEYYSTGELKTRIVRNPYEYEIWEYYQNGARKKVVYGTEENRIIKEFFEDGSMKREERHSPNQEEFDKMRFND